MTISGKSGVTSNGNGYLLSPLYSFILGELIGINNTWMRFRLSIRDNSDFNDYIESGIYGIGYNNSVTITNGPGFSWGVMLVMPMNDYVIQLAFGVTSPYPVKVRSKPQSETWNAWKEFSFK